MKLDKDKLNQFRKLNVSATKANSKKIESIYKTQKGNNNFLSNKENILMFFILKGLKYELKTQKTQEKYDFLNKVTDYNEGRNLDQKVITLDKIIQKFKEKIYFILFSLINNLENILEKPEIFKNIITFLLNKGIDNFDSFEELTYPHVHNILLKDLVGQKDLEEEEEDFTITATNLKYSFIFDGSNIARNKSNSKKVYIQDVLRCRKVLMGYGVPKKNIFIIFGSGVRHYIREQDEAVFKKLLKEENVNQTPKGQDDDWSIIDFAQNNDSYIITNDFYLEHQKKHPNLADFIKTHSIRYTCIGNQIRFEEDFEKKLKSIME